MFRVNGLQVKDWEPNFKVDPSFWIADLSYAMSVNSPIIRIIPNEFMMAFVKIFFLLMTKKYFPLFRGDSIFRWIYNKIFFLSQCHSLSHNSTFRKNTYQFPFISFGVTLITDLLPQHFTENDPRDENIPRVLIRDAQLYRETVKMKMKLKRF